MLPVVIAMPSILMEMLTLALAEGETYDFGKVGPGLSMTKKKDSCEKAAIHQQSVNAFVSKSKRDIRQGGPWDGNDQSRAGGGVEKSWPAKGQ